MNVSIKKTVAIAAIAAMIFTCFGFLAQVGFDTPMASSVSAAAKKGFVKKGSRWYYYKSGKRVKGLKKIGGKYYYFSKAGVMQKGSKKVGKNYYYFNQIKSGKKKGQAPALVKNVAVLGGKVYYYGPTGKRYNYGYKSVGSRKGNIAAGMMISGAKITKSQSKSVKMQKAYRYILKQSEYYPTGAPKLTTNTWIAARAYNMAASADHDGQCYEYAALTHLTFKALGVKGTLKVGSATRTKADGTDPVNVSQHAWVVVGSTVYDAVFDNRTKGKGALSFYGLALDAADNSVTTSSGEKVVYNEKYSYK